MGMGKKLLILCVLFASTSARADVLFNNDKNPFFGDAKNQVGLYVSASTGGTKLMNLIWPGRWESEPFGYIMAQYSQPAQILRLPSRFNIQVGYTIGWGKHDGEDWHDYSMPVFGFSWDVSVLQWRNFYAGAGLGLSYKSKEDVRQDSRLVLGTKVFIGYRIDDRLSAEIFTMHYSNGDLTPVNNSYNFAGVSMLYNF